MKKWINGTLQAAFLAAVLAGATGCIGIYNNTDLFIGGPHMGMDEKTLIDTYGTPAWQGFVEDKKIYTYKVRDNKYILFLGVYEGYDLVVTVEDGKVKDSKRADIAESFTLFSPLPWAITD